MTFPRQVCSSMSTTVYGYLHGLAVRTEPKQLDHPLDGPQAGLDGLQIALSRHAPC